MTIIRGRYNGTVIVPDEPVNLPPDSPVMVLIESENGVDPELERSTREYYQNQPEVERSEDQEWARLSSRAAWD